MKDDFQRGSDQDLNRILEEYSAINQNRAQRSRQNQNIGRNMPQSGNQIPNRNRPVQNIRSHSDPSDSAARSAQQGNPAQRNNMQPKKFVLNIDESILDAPVNEPVRKPNGNSNGIYFSNYQKNRNAAQKPQYPIQSINKPVVSDDNSKRSDSKPVSKTSPSKRKGVGIKEALIFLAVIIVTTTLLSVVGISCVCDMLAINRGEETIEVTVPEGADYKDIIDILHDNGLIKNKIFCTVFSKYRDFDEMKFNGGKYYLTADMGLEGMLRKMFVSPFSSETVVLSFPEGFTVMEIFNKLDKNGVCESSKLYSTIKANYSYDFFKEIQNDPERYLKLEGYMFPDTYEFFVGADTNYVIKKFLDNFQSKWTAEYQARAEKLGYTCDEIIIIASIIQAEANNVDDMKLVSSVIHNRLNNSSVYPTLGCDSTRHYAQNSIMPVIGDAEGMYYAETYDTDSNRGLPPGPICNPGMDAIRAALYPENTRYYFFAHDETGKIYLATTDTEHNINKNEIDRVNESLKMDN